MFFRKRNKLYNIDHHRLFTLIEQYKQSLTNQIALIDRSIDPSEDVLKRKVVTESLYSFLLKEIRYRKEEKFKL